MGIKHLKLTNFRNHTQLEFDPNTKNILIYGANGVGKTNIFEAISLLAPGKGIFNSPSAEILNYQNDSKSWEICCELDSKQGSNKIGSGFSDYQNKRVIKLNETSLQRSVDLLEIIRVIWLVPQMDGILAGAASAKRRFFDRITFNFFPQHALSVSRYEYALKSRSRLLLENYYDPILLSNFEKMLAEESIKINAARNQTIHLISTKFKSFKTSFLYPLISINGKMENDIANLDNLSQIEKICLVLSSNRRIDTLSKRCNYGAHRSEIRFINKDKNVQADLCSTGERKAMLISLIIAQVNALRDVFDGSIILLLDDILSHLDKNFSSELLKELSFVDAQICVTATQDNNSLCNNFIKYAI